MPRAWTKTTTALGMSLREIKTVDPSNSSRICARFDPDLPDGLQEYLPRVPDWDWQLSDDGGKSWRDV
jgi:hypothetical protein